MLREQVLELAGGVCEYCRSPECYSATQFSIEHILPLSRGGVTELGNLAFACQGCNNHKYTAVRAIDKVTGTEVDLYHPRQQAWRDHFAWSSDRTEIKGTSAAGRATVAKLKLNRPNLVRLRKLLLRAKLFPN